MSIWTHCGHWVGTGYVFPSAIGTVGNKEMPMTKYPVIIIGNVRYAPYALMEMQGGEVVSFKTLVNMRQER